MPVFDFVPKPTTVTTFSPPGGRSSATFTVLAVSTPSFYSANFLRDISDDGCGRGVGPGGAGPPGQSCHTNASPPNPPPGPGAPLNPSSSTQSTSESTAQTQSQSTQQSTSTTTDRSSTSTVGTTSTAGTTSATDSSSQPPSSATSAHSTTGGLTTATTSSSDSGTSASTSTSFVVSSYPSLPAESLPGTSSTPIVTFQSSSIATSSQSSSTAAATASSGLSAGSAAGIALGVLVAAILLVGAALFLFLRQRKRRRNGYSAKRKLRWSEGAASKALSSTWTWSWLGSLPIGSEFDSASTQQRKDARRTSQQSNASDNPFRDTASESDKSATMVAFGAPSVPAALAVHVHEEVEQAYDPPSQPRHGPEDSSGAAHVLALAATLPFSSYGVRAMYASESDGRNVTPDSETGRGRVQESQDPFADPRRSGISQTLTVASSADVQSVEAQ